MTDRGRDRFQRKRGLLQRAESLVRVLPRRLREQVFTSIRWLPGTLGEAMRYVLLRTLARECGEVVRLLPGVYVLNPESLSIGSNVSLHPMTYLECLGGIQIGSDVSIAHGCTLQSTHHDFGAAPDLPIRDAPVSYRPVTVGSDVWIAAGVKVIGGSTIGDRTVVAAGAVVIGSHAGNEVLGGIPARTLRPLRPYESVEGP